MSFIERKHSKVDFWFEKDVIFQIHLHGRNFGHALSACPPNIGCEYHFKDPKQAKRAPKEPNLLFYKINTKTIPMHHLDSQSKLKKNAMYVPYFLK